MIYVLGISGSTINDRQRGYLAGCRSLVVSKRYRLLVDDFGGEIIPIAPVKGVLAAIENHLVLGDVAVLASGDPLFFGIGRTLIEYFGPDQVEIIPEISYLQLACARFKISWDDAEVISLHGRSREQVVAKLLQHPKVIVFTDAQFSPDRLAGELLSCLELLGAEAKIAELRIRVAENLGSGEEKLIEGTLQEIAALSFAPVNIMIITSSNLAGSSNGPFGLTEADLIKSRGLITKDEVRAVTLHKLGLPRQGVFWDIGGGSGSISIEAARLCPELFVYIIEKEEEQRQNICQNIIANETFNVIPVPGTAPEALAELPDPDRIFIGGSGGRLAEILASCTKRLKEDGRIVVNCVLEKTRKTAPELLARKGYEVSLTEVNVSRIFEAKENEKRIDLNPITVVMGKK